MASKKSRGIKTPPPGVAGRAFQPSVPEIKVSFTPVGRETLAAIELELAEPGRDTLPTLPYGDRVPNAPGAVTPSQFPRDKPRKPPPARPPNRGRAAREAEAQPPRAATAPAALEIYEPLTFVARKVDAAALASEAERRSFVESRLLHRIPGNTMAGVARVDAAPSSDRETWIVRVWCRVAPP